MYVEFLVPTTRHLTISVSIHHPSFLPVKKRKQKRRVLYINLPRPSPVVDSSNQKFGVSPPSFPKSKEKKKKKTERPPPAIESIDIRQL